METLTTTKSRTIVAISDTFVLLRNNLVYVPTGTGRPTNQFLGTICANLAYYGFTLSKEAFKALSTLSDDEVGTWWSSFEPELKRITGDDKNMGDFVVYKNFPREVLEMSQAQYWISQILMYIGLPNEWFTEEVEEREPLNEKLELKVLHLTTNKEKSLSEIFNGLLKAPFSWTDEQRETVKCLALMFEVDLSNIPFKENMIGMAIYLMSMGYSFTTTSATDVLRLSVAMSNGDFTLKTVTKFAKFKRADRRLLLTLLEGCGNLEDDFARYPNRWKQLLSRLHPNEKRGKYPNVSSAYDKLYNDKLTTFNSRLEALISERDMSALTLLSTRAGIFTRRLQEMIKIYDQDAVATYISILDKLTISQLLKMGSYIGTINERVFRTIAPKGNWTKLQILDNDVRIDDKYRLELMDAIGKEIAKRLKDNGVKTVNLSEDTKAIKIQTNDSDLAPYGRGTEFPIPDDIKFIRTASYWKAKGYGNIWFDNGWNFFGENWELKGTCCWDINEFGNKAAIFSGDPTNSKEMQGRACQMIDLYLDKLVAQGVRYAVWNVLCYSHVAFSKAEDVFAALQWGTEPQRGKLFEPSRCQLSFQVDGDTLTKYIAYLDLKERKVVYMDANLYGNVRSARTNGTKLQEVMPAYVEYLQSLPSVYDMFSSCRKHKRGLHVLYNDADYTIEDGKTAYVFKPVNEENDFTQLDLSNLLSS